MASKLINSVYNFRESFQAIHKEALQWYPGHMGRSVKDIQRKLKLVDCVIEVQDARIPITGRNPNFQNISGIKPHILVLNKKDLADLKMKSEVEDALKKSGVHEIIYTNSKDTKCSGMKEIVPTICKLISSSDRYNRTECKDYCAMVIGVPNVGKSSLINGLRVKYIGKGNATKIGATAGITRSIQTRIKVSENPLLYIIDTPGILQPHIPDLEKGLRLALCSCLKDNLVGTEIIADYLLFWLNKNGNFQYVHFMGLQEPTDNIVSVLTNCAILLGKYRKLRSSNGSGYIYKPDITFSAQYFLQAFRSGKFGKVMLDKDCVYIANGEL
ncbi:Mitochondrial GTPase 1 [Blattella germanica]|nr:Mitochondrial GTPase 1 [Blattella germanica]